MQEHFKSESSALQPLSANLNNNIHQLSESHILRNLPADAPDWLQPYHLEHYGGFYNSWLKYSTAMEDGQERDYWYNAQTQKSTWDSPLLILTSLIINGIESD